MKTAILKTSLFLVFFFSILGINAQNYEDSVLYDDNGVPLCIKNDIIIKFNPQVIDTSMVNDTSIQGGIISDFVNPLALQYLIDSGYFDTLFANLSVRKIHHNMTAYDTISITRIGEELRIPEFWSTFLIKWDPALGLDWLEAIDSLNTLWPIVEYAHPNGLYVFDNAANDPKYTGGGQSGLNSQYIVGNINIEPAWDLTTGNSNIKVGVYDDGINWDHVDFSNNNTQTWSNSVVKGGWDWSKGSKGKHPSQITDFDFGGHGTAIASIIGAVRNNNEGVAGIAGGDNSNGQQGVSLYTMKIFVSGSSWATDAQIANAITEGATSNNGKYGYSLNVINCSWHFTILHNSLNDAIRYCFNNKVVVAAAAGNKGIIIDHYPATCKDEFVLKVGSFDGSKVKFGSSNYGAQLDFLAPGAKNLYTFLNAADNTGYGSYSENGTSFATPHAAGVAALMLSYINNHNLAPNKLAPEDVENLIQKYCEDLEQYITPPYAYPGYDDATGFGKLDAGATLQGLQLPRYRVEHYSTVFSNNNASLVSNNVMVNVAKSSPGLRAGNYLADIYEITKTFNISQPSGRTVLDVWARNSSSTLAKNLPFESEVNSVVTSWNQTTATMKGYIYFFKAKSGFGRFYPHWYPATGISGNGYMSLSVYSEDPLASNNSELSINKDYLRIMPNPSNGQFKIMFNLIKNTDIKIELMDMAGKKIYMSNKESKNAGHQELDLNIENLNNGMYICNIISNEGVVSKKISIVK